MTIITFNNFLLRILDLNKSIVIDTDDSSSEGIAMFRTAVKVIEALFRSI